MLFLALNTQFAPKPMGLGQGLTMPLFFSSNALYPIAFMPSRRRVV
jgi:hypothetical protein